MLIDKTTRGRLDTETMRKNLKSVLESYSSANAQEKNMLLKSILEKAVYHKEKGWMPAQFQLELSLKPIYL